MSTVMGAVPQRWPLNAHNEASVPALTVGSDL